MSIMEKYFQLHRVVFVLTALSYMSFWKNTLWNVPAFSVISTTVESDKSCVLREISFSAIPRTNVSSETSSFRSDVCGLPRNYPARHIRRLRRRGNKIVVGAMVTQPRYAIKSHEIRKSVTSRDWWHSTDSLWRTYFSLSDLNISNINRHFVSKICQ